MAHFYKKKCWHIIELNDQSSDDAAMWNRLCRFLNKMKQIGVITVKVRYANNAERLLLLSSFENWLPYDLKLIPFGRSNHKIKCANNEELWFAEAAAVERDINRKRHLWKIERKRILTI